MNTKTLILSNQSDSAYNSKKAILTLIQQDNGVLAKIRLYNLNELQADTRFAIYYEERVFSQKLTRAKDVYCCEIFENINIDNDFHCALTCLENGQNKVLLAGGTYGGMYFDENTSIFSPKEKEPEIEELIDEELKKQDLVEEQNDVTDEDELIASPCEHCTYKKEFYSQLTTNENNFQSQHEQTTMFEETITQQVESDSTINENEAIKQSEKTDMGEFLSQITEQLDDMFASYPIDEQIVQLLPNSKFIKVEDVDGDSNYIIGVIYENEKIKYLAYGVPARYDAEPPVEMGSNHQFLPLNPDDPMSDGYYLIYQNADDGSIVNLKIG